MYRCISTHAPLAGRDFLLKNKIFYVNIISTHAPLAGRDFYLGVISASVDISTHAPLAGRDV